MEDKIISSRNMEHCSNAISNDYGLWYHATMRQTLTTLLSSRQYQESNLTLPVLLGTTNENDISLIDVTKSPHVLIGGAPAQGKTMLLHSIILSLLLKKSPQELKLVLIDPTKIEFGVYAFLNEQHFYHSTHGKEKVLSHISSCIEMVKCLTDEMDLRYDLLHRAKCRNIKEYNHKIHSGQIPQNAEYNIMPYIVVIIDEFSDVAVAGGEEFLSMFMHLLSLSRSVGIHIIFSTYRHDTDIITGMIKANVPVRIGFRFIDKHASLRLLDRVVQQDYLGVGEAIYSEGSCAFRINTPYLEVPEIEVMIAQINKAH